VSRDRVAPQGGPRSDTGRPAPVGCADDGYSVLHLAARCERPQGKPNNTIMYLVEDKSGPTMFAPPRGI
jgi:hypothetical protein